MTAEYETDLAADAYNADASRLNGLLDRLYHGILYIKRGEGVDALPDIMLRDITDTISELEILSMNITKPTAPTVE